MSTRKEKSKERLKAALGKMAEAARELVEVEQAYYGRKPKEPPKPTILSGGAEND